MSVRDVVERQPDQRACAGRDVRVEQRERRLVVRLERRHAVEAVPTGPDERGADDGQRQVVVRRVLPRVELVVLDALLQQQRHHQARHARRQVDHHAARKVLAAERRQPAVGMVSVVPQLYL